MCFAFADELFDEDFRPAEGGAGFALRLLEFFRQLVRGGDDAHPAPAAAVARLDDDRIADLLRRLLHLGDGFEARARSPGTVGTFALAATRLAAVLSPNISSSLGVGPTEGDPGVRARLGEFRSLGEEPVPRMNRIDAVLLGDRDDVGDVEVPLDRLAALGRADHIRLIGFETVQREAVFPSVDGDGSKAELGCRAEHADGDLTSIGDQQLAHA
jgi:hypothetical protein